MGFYIRKSVSVGPFRFNLSKSGVGVSAGVKGLRLGTGPRGNYVHMGAGGLYYRTSLSPSSARQTPQSRLRFDNTQPINVPANTHEQLQEIESSAVEGMVDSSSKELVDELNAKRKRTRLWPVSAVATIVALGMVASQSPPPWVGYVVTAIGTLLTGVTYYKDLLGKTAVVLYDIESDFSGVIEQLHTAFEAMKGCRSAWHLEAHGRVHDRKYHAGASHLVRRNRISLTYRNPPYVKTNVATPSIPVGRQILYFFPDKVLVFDPNGVGAVSYENLTIHIAASRFIEDGGVPADAKVVDHTWKYVNKKGGPDKRFKDNRKIPVVVYEEVHFSSSTGLNERIQLSSTGRTSEFDRAIKKVGNANAAAG